MPLLVKDSLFPQDENDYKGDFHYLKRSKKCKTAFEKSSVIIHFRTSILKEGVVIKEFVLVVINEFMLVVSFLTNFIY